MNFRVSTLEDVPALRNLFFLAFHDEGPYMDNFFQNYCTPDKMLVAEDGGEIVAMTAYFATEVHWNQAASYPFAYLYAVATLPERQGEGIAGNLLRFVFDHMVELGFVGVTTVPAEPSLYQFFGRQGFVKSFVQEQIRLTACPQGACPSSLEEVSPAEYQRRRAEFLSTQPLWVDCGLPGLVYQQGVCHLGNGGLFATETSLCTLEEGGHGVYVAKEVLGSWDTVVALWDRLDPKLLILRNPVTGDRPDLEQNFGMIQWLTPQPQGLTGTERGYFGLGFD